MDRIRMIRPASARRIVAMNRMAATVARRGISRGARVIQSDSSSNASRRPPNSAARRTGGAPAAPGATCMGV